eukprot:7012426-Prymnesium_polylepis.1
MHWATPTSVASNERQAIHPARPPKAPTAWLSTSIPVHACSTAPSACSAARRAKLTGRTRVSGAVRDRS